MSTGTRVGNLTKVAVDKGVGEHLVVARLAQTIRMTLTPAEEAEEADAVAPTDLPRAARLTMVLTPISLMTAQTRRTQTS